MADRDPTGHEGAPGWRTSTHFDYRDCALEALGDERQVYARSTSSKQRDLVFLPDGEADRFRAAAQSGELVCPVPGCPSPLLTTRGPRRRRHHFVHRQAPPDPDHQRAYVRRVATELITDWISAAHPQSTVENEITLAGMSVPALVTGPAGRRFAVMFVDRRLGAEAWWDADFELEREDLARGWIFAPRPFLRFPRPSKDAGPDDPAAVDRERGDVVLDRPVFREMRQAGQWPLLININTREVANLLVPDGLIARRLRLRPPASGDRVLHLHPTPLDECRLCRDGIATPDVDAGVLAAPRLARERPRTSLQSPTPSVTHGHVSSPVVERPVERPVPGSRANTSERAAMLERLRKVLGWSGGVTTLASLIVELGGYDALDEPLLRELLDKLRAEDVIEFEPPLGRFSAIRQR